MALNPAFFSPSTFTLLNQNSQATEEALPSGWDKAKRKKTESSKENKQTCKPFLLNPQPVKLSLLEKLLFQVLGCPSGNRLKANVSQKLFAKG